MYAIGREAPGLVEAVRAFVAEHGPLTVGDLLDAGAAVVVDVGLEPGQARARVPVLERRGHRPPAAADFARVYDLTERVVPPAVLAQPAPAEDEAKRELLLMAARSLGVATLQDLCDYHRINVPRARPLVAELAEEGRLVPVTVEGWDRPAYLHPDAAIPRAARARALLSPFDSLVWFRPRTERLFGFRYRLEIYVPAPQAGARLLRAAVPPRRPARGAGGPEGRPRRPARCWSRRPTPSRARPPPPPPTRWPPSSPSWPGGWASGTSGWPGAATWRPSWRRPPPRRR